MDKKKLPRSKREHISQQYKQVRPLLHLAGLADPKFAKSLDKFEDQFANVQRMVAERAEFSARFGPKGWTYYDRLSVDVVHEVLGLDADRAETALDEYHLNSDQLQFLGYRFFTSRYAPWQELYERAVERALAADYLSAIPLVLIIIDGICTTTTGKHPFSGGADAPVFDSETSGPGGIADGLAILGATRRKLDTSPIDSPFRHGILHGLNPNFGHARVAAKAFNLLQSSVDYFDRRADEDVRIAKAEAEQAPPDLGELLHSLAKTADTKRQIEEWRARPVRRDESIASSEAPHKLAPGSPEAAAAEYLAALTRRNFGALAKSTIDYMKRPIAQRAGLHRETLGDLKVTAWEITGVEDHAAAVSVITVQIEGIHREHTWSATQQMRLIYADENFDVLPRGSAGGQWSVMALFISGLWGPATASCLDPKGTDGTA